ncbi:calymmin [Silurus meridionalis]|uniref:calymmin n=1 Tax=Silurus meridionalis TaxID=175797 RepID=UPI001EEA09A3|nr:calymmin [Silurus meridionalis]
MGYGSKPNKPGYGAQPSYGGLGAGMRMSPQLANTGRAGGGYKDGAKATKTGYGGGKLVQSGQPAKPNGYGPGIGGQNGQGAKPAGYGGYPNGGGFKGLKPAYSSLPTGYRQRPNGYGGYPNGGAKPPKPGYGVPAGVLNIKAGNGHITNGNEKGPKGKSLGSEVHGLPLVSGYNKGVVQPAEPEPTVGVPTALQPTNGNPFQRWKGPKPHVPQGYPSNPIMPEQVPVIPQNKAPKPAQYIGQGQVPIQELSLIPQVKGPKPFGQLGQEILQGNPQTPINPALLPIVQQEKTPKPIAQVPQPVAPAYPQNNGPKPVAVQPAVPQANAPKPTAPVQLPVITQAKGPKPVAPFSEILQTKGPKPVAPEPVAPQTVVPSLALEPTPAMPQMKGPNVANPDCGLGVSGQWTKLPSPGYGPVPWISNNEGAKASKPGPKHGSQSKQPGYVNPGAGYGYGNGGAGQLLYNGAPIIPARLDGSSPIEAQTAELGPEVKSGFAYGGPYGAQSIGLGSEGKPQVRFGIGGLLFGGSPTGYGSNPYGKYGNPYAAQPYASKAAGNFNPFGYNASPKSSAQYKTEGSLYTAGATGAKASGKYGPYGGQLGLPAGNFGIYGQNVGPYAPEPLSLSGDAKSSGKYGSPSLPFETLGPVTDGQSIDQPALQYEAPAIDGVKSVDQFGDGEVQPQPIASLLDGVGAEPASYVKGAVRAEAVSLPAVPTDNPFTGSAVSLGNPAHSPVDTPTAAVTQQHVSAQQNLKGPQAQFWTGGKELKHNLKGFFGN